MKIFVRAKPRAKKEFIKEIDRTHFVIAVREPAKDNKANRAIIRMLARHLNVAQSRIGFISGTQAKEKVFEVA